MEARVLVADDHRILREGIRRILEAHADLRVVAEADTGEEAVRLAAEAAPNVAVIDVTMPRLSGIEAIRRIRSGSPQTRCLALSMHETHAQVTQALQAGASGYVVKTASAEEFVDAVRATADGKSYLSPSIAHCVVEAIAQPRDGSAFTVAQLSGREREVLQLIAEGLSSKEIAGVLGVSLKTVETHRSNLMGKLNIRKASKLVRIAIHEGLVAP
ncbi:MAG: DNA-binding response regulator [Proteobacteria bacterium]|nr:MAG: DNA-binding response regulator [Pseudomonadota bacterium]